MASEVWGWGGARAAGREVGSFGQYEMGTPRGWWVAPSQVRPRLALKVTVHGAPTPSSQDLVACRGHSKSGCIKICSATQLWFLEGPGVATFWHVQACTHLAGPPRGRLFVLKCCIYGIKNNRSVGLGCVLPTLEMGDAPSLDVFSQDCTLFPYPTSHSPSWAFD